MAERDSKGTFGERRLPVAEKYVFPIDRNKMVWAGLAVALLVAAWVAVDAFVLDGDVISAGPLSRAHAALEERGSCDSCHVALESASAASCAACHGDVAAGRSAFGHAAHVLYESNDLQRVTDHESDSALPCMSCHTEHQGRDAEITRVADSACGTCHFDGFDEHPEFAFVRLRGAKERAGLEFPHVKHVRKLIEKNDLAQIETACLYCHQGESNGGFASIDFDLHCSNKGCHAQGKEKTGWVPTATASSPGVYLPSSIRGPGSSWARLSDPGSFESQGGEVRKLALLHSDPWVLYNLRQLRRGTGSEPDLADLLQASPAASPGDARDLYAEAIETLRSWIAELRTTPDKSVQKDLEWASQQLEIIERQLANPFQPALASTFAPSAPAELDPAQEDAVDEIEAGLTKWCSKCHGVADGAIVRPQSDQSELVRARFDHGPHALQQGCLDCHSAGYSAGECVGEDPEVPDWRIPFCDFLSPNDLSDPASPVLVDAAKHDVDVPTRYNDPAWLNLPGIDQCRSCHTSAETGNACVSCHEYHPHKDKGAHLSRFQNGS